MLIWSAEWDKIRGGYTEGEKNELRAALNGEIICPPAFSIDESKVRVELLDTLKNDLKGVR